MASDTSSRAQARMDFKMEEFAQKVAQIQKAWGRESKTFVLSTARKLVKKFAFEAPVDTGRLRAGFWPAAISMQVTQIYDYKGHGNKNEGAGIVKLTAKNPMIKIVNSVPYVANAGGRGMSWWFKSMSAIMFRLDRELENHVKKAWQAGR